MVPRWAFLTDMLMARGRRPVRTQGCTWLSSLFWSSVNRGWCFCMLLRASRSSRSTVSMSLLQKHPFIVTTVHWKKKNAEEET